MYESHFGFHRQPFQCAELTRAFFVSQSIQTILPQLLHALRSDLGIAVLTGPAGVGKTSLLKHLQLLLAKEGRAIVCSGASLETPLNVLQTLHTSLHGRAAQKASIELASRDVSQSRWTLLDQLQKTSELWGPVLLLIDDAQLLPVSVLNELRAFTEEEWNGRSLIRCLIAGPLSLEEELARPTHADFSHRIRCHAFLQPLTSRESLELLNRHIDVVGGQLNKVFTAKALELIALACDGLPRCLSLLADESLVVAAERKHHVADEECVRTALGRLQHLPYPWSASPMLSQEDSAEVEDHAVESRSSQTSIVPTVSTSTSDSNSRFIEVGSSAGSSAVIEFGGPALAAPKALVAANSVASESRMIPSASKPGAIEFGSFEVGRRFTQEATDIVDAASEAADLVDLETTLVDVDMPGVNVGYGVSWENLEESFAVTEFTSSVKITSSPAETMASPSSKPVTNTSVVFTGSAGHELPVGTAAVDSTERSDDRWLSAMAGSGFAQRLPVFDRYTWVALGREVPAGSYSVRSSSMVHRAAYDDAVAQTSGARANRSRTFDSIGMFDTTEEEIDRRLASVTESAALGEFVVSRTTDRPAQYAVLDMAQGVTGESSQVPAIGVEFFNPPEPLVETFEFVGVPSTEPVKSDENRRAIRDAILSRLSQVDSFRDRTDIEDLVDSAISSFGGADSHEQPHDSQWLDGQLVFGKPAVSEMNSEPLPSGSDEESEQMSLNFESARLARQEIADPAVEETRSERGTFFTLPPEVNAITWDLRSEVIESDDFLPLAESLSALQNEVSTFHQNLGRDDNDRRSSDRVVDGTSNYGDDSLVAQARRRLDEATMNHESPAQVVPTGFVSTLGPAASGYGSVAEESNTAAQVEVKPPATFGQLFTRLRQLRKSSGEN